ncbi:phosphodiester glycosidase family protein [Allorhizobium undicola]
MALAQKKSWQGTMKSVLSRVFLSTVFLHVLRAASPAQPVATYPSDDCRIELWQNARYTICTVDPAHETIRIYNRSPEGKPFGSFDALRRALWDEHAILRLAFNGGMYEEDLSPVGLHVEYGRTRKPINLADGWGNFYMKPNGVFYIAGAKAGVMASEAFAKAGMEVDFATQSGPMLVTNGKIHPRFLPDSDSRKIRNGVGVDRNGKVVFVISEEPVRFYDLASLYHDRLDTPDALFLDGSISSMAYPAAGRMDKAFPLGTIIAVIAPRP